MCVWVMCKVIRKGGYEVKRQGCEELIGPGCGGLGGGTWC